MKERKASIPCVIEHQAGLEFNLEKVHHIWGTRYDEGFQVYLGREMLCKLRVEKAVSSQSKVKTQADPREFKLSPKEPGCMRPDSPKLILSYSHSPSECQTDPGLCLQQSLRVVAVNGLVTPTARAPQTASTRGFYFLGHKTTQQSSILLVGKASAWALRSSQ